MNLSGWIDDQKAVEAVMSELPFPVFGDVWGSTKESGKGKVVILTDVLEKVAGYFPLRKQLQSDCVAVSSALAVDIAKAVDIWIKKEFELWVAETASEDIYGGSRVIIGKGRLGRGGGSVGAWAARWVNEYGALPRGKYGSVDLSKYDVNRVTEWAVKGPPQELLPFSKEHPIQTVSLVETYEQLRDLIANGYPVTVASSQGFSSKRDKDGFAAPQGTWQHQMCIAGIDDEYKRPGGLICNCFDKETEILTENGWKTFEDLMDHEKVATVNLEKWELQYQLPTEHQKVKYNGEMLHFKSQSFDCLVTPNHNMVYWSKHKKSVRKEEFCIAPAETMKKSNSFIRYVKNWKGEEQDYINICGYEILMDDWLQFLGFYLAEGWANVRIRERSRKNSSIITIEKDGYLGICQNEGSTLEYMEEIVSRLPFKFSKKKLHGSDKHYQLLCYNSEFAEYLKQFGKCHEKFIPKYVFDLPKEQQRLIFNCMMLGDGSSKGNMYYTTSVKLKDDFQRLCIHLGFTSDSYISRKKGTIVCGVIANNDGWIVSVQSKFNISGSSCVAEIREPKKVQYNDYVYCVTVPNHTVIVRRNGKMLITGQSWGVFNSGPKRHNQPDGSFWVDADVLQRMLSRKDSWAYSSYVGFKPQNINTRII